MPLKRLFIQKLPVESGTLVLGPDVYNRLARVLRMQTGDNLAIFDSRGYETNARIVNLQKNKTTVRIQKAAKISRESSWDITLAFAMPKGHKPDLILQKGTELGVRKFMIFNAERSVSRPSEKRIQTKISRWNEIIKSAVEQCGRTYFPELLFFPDAVALLSNINETVRLAFLPDATMNIYSFMNKKPDTVALLIGPEGGFTPSERESIKKFNFFTVSLGRRILRAETAAITAVAPFSFD